VTFLKNNFVYYGVTLSQVNHTKYCYYFTNYVKYGIINYNSASCLAIAMESLMNVSTRVPFSVGIIDNGSVDEEKNACKKLVQDMQSKYPQQELKLFDAGKNLGFSGGNNVVIKYFLEKEDISRLSLLAAFEVRAKTITPPTGRSNRCTSPQ